MLFSPSCFPLGLYNFIDGSPLRMLISAVYSAHIISSRYEIPLALASSRISIVAVAPIRVTPRERTRKTSSSVRTPPAALTCTDPEHFSLNSVNWWSTAPLYEYIPLGCFTNPYPVEVFMNATPCSEHISQSLAMCLSERKSF